MTMTVRPDGVRAAEVIQVVRTVALRGHGTPDDLVREVTQYWSLEGQLLAESDAFASSQQERGEDDGREAPCRPGGNHGLCRTHPTCERVRERLQAVVEERDHYRRIAEEQAIELGARRPAEKPTPAEPPDKRLPPMNEATPEGHCAVEAACVHRCLDERGVPRADAEGQVYSLWGRVCRFVERPN